VVDLVVKVRPLGVVQRMTPRFGLFEPPAGSVLGVVMPRAGRREIAFAGVAARPGLGVVEFAALRLGFTAVGGTGSGAGADQVGERAGWPVAVLLVPVTAFAAGDGLGAHAEVAEERFQVLLPFSRGRAGWGRFPGMAAACAAMGDRLALVADLGDAPAGGGVQ
jgi:hypothetical protein